MVYSAVAHGLTLAEEEAATAAKNYVGTEQILLGVISEGEGIAANVLASLGITAEAIRQQSESTDRIEAPSSGDSPFTSRAERVLEQSVREGLQLGRSLVDPEDILLGLIRVGENRATDVLVWLGADAHRIRMRVIKELSGQGSNGAES